MLSVGLRYRKAAALPPPLPPAPRHAQHHRPHRRASVHGLSLSHSNLGTAPMGTAPTQDGTGISGDWPGSVRLVTVFARRAVCLEQRCLQLRQLLRAVCLLPTTGCAPSAFGRYFDYIHACARAHKGGHAPRVGKRGCKRLTAPCGPATRGRPSARELACGGSESRSPCCCEVEPDARFGRLCS
eukprot:COSAG02_NODE_6112_length_3791_cov_2.780065_3_plen_184_part_00